MLRVKQALLVALGVGLAVAMVLLGLWQLRVYQAQGAAAAEERAAQPPVPLTSVARAGAPVGDGFGRTVTLDGRFDPNLQVLVPDAGGATARVLTGLRQDDGSVVPVVRGRVAGSVAPPPPRGTFSWSGILLPSEPPADDAAATAGQLDSVRVAALAQTWPGPLIGGFVTLSPTEAEQQGLMPAEVALPDAPGRLRNGAYALQWWLFAAFAVVMSVRMARDLGLQAAEMPASASPPPT